MISTFVVDDEPAALDRYAGYVEEYGQPFIVSARCRSAEAAYDEAERSPPDLIISDIRMPGENGLSLLSRLRDSGWKGQAVIVSGFDDFGYAQKAIRLGVLDFLLKPVFPEDMRRLLDTVAGRLSSTYRAAQPERAGPAAALSAAALPLPVRRALAFLDQHYDCRFTIEEVARAACMSSAWLCSCFKRSTGMSVMEYARRCRAAKAGELLASSDIPLKEIADRLAFPDLATFSKLFRKLMGVSPGAYRKNLRGG